MSTKSIFGVLVAVALMFGVAEAELTHQFTFEDGTTNDYVGGTTGTLVGGAAVADGALVTTAQDQWMEMDAAAIAINTYPEITLECWYHPTAGANTGWSMLAYLGDSSDPDPSLGVGHSGLFITSARGDNKSRAAISTLDTGSPWTAESGADGPEYDDDALHHMVGVFSASEVALYIDGVLAISPGDPNPNVNTDLFSDLSNNLAYLAKGGYGGDPEWIGQILEFNLYNNALSADDVAANFAAGPIPEPATIALLGLGGLALLRRRR